MVSKYMCHTHFDSVSFLVRATHRSRWNHVRHFLHWTISSAKHSGIRHEQWIWIVWVSRVAFLFSLPILVIGKGENAPFTRHEYKCSLIAPCWNLNALGCPPAANTAAYAREKKTTVCCSSLLLILHVPACVQVNKLYGIQINGNLLTYLTVIVFWSVCSKTAICLWRAFVNTGYVLS